jgi:hypothetical protein
VSDLTALSQRDIDILNGAHGLSSPLAGMAPRVLLGTRLDEVTGLDDRVTALETVNTVADETDRDVLATVTVPDTAGGGTAALSTVQLYRPDGVTPIAAARQVLILAKAAAYSGLAVAGSATFGTATVGSIIASGTGWALVQTSATGAFACTISNSADETLFFTAHPPQGVSDKTLAVRSVASNSDSATWAA